jgi:hypothetical protein
LQASCTQCHPTATLSKSAGHDANHANVDCWACHDASGLQVGPVGSVQGEWSTLRTIVVGGVNITGKYVSHNLQRQVSCTRCHYAGNTWGLKTH